MQFENSQSTSVHSGKKPHLAINLKMFRHLIHFLQAANKNPDMKSIGLLMIKRNYYFLKILRGNKVKS